MFITFEGIDGSGKTTQLNLLKQSLEEKNLSVIQTKEPGGGGDIASQIREIFLQNDSIDINTQIALINAARNENLTNVVIPALKEKKIVLCDRFIDSTTVYQGVYMNMKIEEIKKIHEIICHNLYPDLTIIMDINPEEAQKRLKKRNGMQMDLIKEEQNIQSDHSHENLIKEDFEKENHFDLIDIEKKHIMRNGFIDLANQEPNRFVIVDASLCEKEISNKILNIVLGYLLF